MRSDHGAMGAARYREEKKRCECGGLDNRDHLLLDCLKWEKERERVWMGWEKEDLRREEGVEMDKLLFEEDGVKRLEKYAEEIGWKGWVWEGGRWGNNREGEGRRRIFVGGESIVGRGRWLEERKEKDRKARRERYRKKKEEEMALITGVSPNASGTTVVRSYRREGENEEERRKARERAKRWRERRRQEREG